VENGDERAAALDAVHAAWGDEASLDELERLADSAGIAVAGRLTQRLRTPHPQTYINEGKAREAALLAAELGCSLILVDDELTPRQQRGLEEVCRGQQRVIDRTVLILDIFAQRARTREAAVQVELAQLTYQIPRLVRSWTHLERQRGGTGRSAGMGGGTGFRGPGETQIETDRRQIRVAIKRLEQELETVRARRDVQRTARHAGWVCAALVGYTNAGKSTLLNRLAGADVQAEDRLFATLDPTTRRWDLNGGGTVLLTDTVGFIHKLPASLVAAFRATLEEVSAADVLIHLVDASHPDALAQAEVALAEIAALGATSQPVVTALNKVDMLGDEAGTARLETLRALMPGAVALSARTGQGCDVLAEQVRLAMRTVRRRTEAPALAGTHAGD
jgi:GTP-binding protein HflX